MSCSTSDDNPSGEDTPDSQSTQGDLTDFDIGASGNAGDGEKGSDNHTSTDNITESIQGDDSKQESNDEEDESDPEWKQLVAEVEASEPPEDLPKALGIARRSKPDAEQESSTLKSRIREIIAQAEEHELGLVGIVVDDGETGQSLDRPAIREARRRFATEDIEYLVIQHWSRLGRNYPSVTSFLLDAKVEFDIDLLVENRIWDFEDPDDKMFIGMKAIMADQSGDYRIQEATNACRQNFTDNKIWRSWFPNSIPFGCSERDDEWIELDGDYNELIRRMHDILPELNLGSPYADLRDRISDEFEHLSADENGPPLDELDSSRIKRILQDPVYTGRIPIGANREKIEDIVSDPDKSLCEELDDLAAVVDEELQVIDIQTYERTLDKLERIRQYHNSSETVLDAPEVVAEYGIERVVTWVDCISVKCPKCDTEMTKDGTRTDYHPHRQVYECENNHYTVLPNDTHLDDLEEDGNDDGDNEADTT